MPQRIGQGLRNFSVSSKARSWVLSPISAIATRPVEMAKAFRENIGAGEPKIVGSDEGGTSARQPSSNPDPVTAPKVSPDPAIPLPVTARPLRPWCRSERRPSLLTGPLREMQAATPQWARRQIAGFPRNGKVRLVAPRLGQEFQTP